jgi:hypothetical protein
LGGALVGYRGGGMFFRAKHKGGPVAPFTPAARF